ncbi:uroporphyrinogen-III synthase [Hydrogenovibrio kuenenii]|uniref:uroporphyrinogen-III synthase n=1 Tax=Hydrogenovibrio kuenenii TaxID=63658 RepID=UPI0004676C22|nr:uroporphyrinogen-III synthase [Hydrogenovibrio kuenenii]
MSTATLLNTRPATQAVALSELLEKAGYKSLFCPSIHIDLIKAAPPSLADFQFIFFVSANAVNSLADNWLEKFGTPIILPDSVTCFAIGKATARALANLGIDAKIPNNKFDTRTLMAEFSANHFQGAACLIIKGEGGLPDLADSLKQQGAQVSEWVGYRRLAAEFCHQSWQVFRQAAHPVLLASSFESWVALADQITQSKEKNWLLQQDLIAFSERIANEIRAQGWLGRIEVVKIQSNQGVVETLKRLG